MRKEKGFTLIELLAVIVILAIIALIATPIVLNIARKGAFARSAEGVLKASKIYYASSLIEEVTPKEQEFTCDNKTCVTESNIKLDVDGSMGEGNVKITSDGKISFELGNGTYCAEKEEDSDKITITEKKCGEIVINKPTNLKITYKTEKSGEITVVGSVSNKLAEIESFEFSIDNGTTWEKSESNTYTFTGLELGKEYRVLMRVTNKNKEVEQIELDSIMTSLMDANQLGDNSNMAHCTNDTSSSTDCGVDSTKKYYVYSWDKSKIRKYLNGEFLTSLESKIENEIVSTSICADPSRNDNSKTYGAYLKKELDFLGMSSKCSKYTEDKIRLASNSEVFYMSPYYSSNSSIYPNVDGIVRLDSNSDYESWFISSSNNYFWTLSASIDTKSVVSVEWTGSVNYPGTVADNHSFVSFAVRPVITIVK